MQRSVWPGVASGDFGANVGGPVRRAHPASGAQWNVQVVRGKMTGRCLWNACKAFSLGLLLMFFGAAMALIGYHANHLSVGLEVRGNHTVKVKNETRNFHLNNLSYAGPIVMGVGGFIVVAACVMTFEARDSAAKVVPARFKQSTTAGPALCRGGARGGTISGTTGAGSSLHRSAASQTPGSMVHVGSIGSAGRSGTPTGGGGAIGGGGSFKHSDGYRQSPITDRRSITSALQQFSRELGDSWRSPRRPTRLLSIDTALPRSPSAPLLYNGSSPQQVPSPLESCIISGSPRVTLQRNTGYPAVARKQQQRTGVLRHGALLSPAGLLKRHAISVDESGGMPYRCSRESLQGSQTSMAMDLHIPNDCPVTLRVCDTRRHMLTRQRPVEVADDATINGGASTSSAGNQMVSVTPLPTISSVSGSSSTAVIQPQPMQHHRHHHHHHHYHRHRRSSVSKRRSSNASEHVHRLSWSGRRGTGPLLERAASTDARVACPAGDVCHGCQQAAARATCSQEIIQHSRVSLTGAGGSVPSTSSGIGSRYGYAFRPTHVNSGIEVRRQRSYSPHGSREAVQLEPVAKDC